MVRLQMVVQVTVRATAHLFPYLGFDGSRISAVAIGGDPRWDTTGDGVGRAKEGLRRRYVALLTEQDIHQVPSRSMAR